MSIQGDPKMGEWGDRAARLYEESYAERYRAVDDTLGANEAFAELSRWLAGVCGSLKPPIAVLDVGCGTGRYFASLTGVRQLVGLDASRPMLERARHPIDADRVTAEHVVLVCGDVETHAFEPGQFDLIYSIGVLAEHLPLTEALVQRVGRVVGAGRPVRFTAVHPESFSIPLTWKRRAGRQLLRVTTGSLHRRIRERWLGDGFYADEARVREVLASAGLVVESLARMRDVHLHCLAVARKPGA